MLLLLRAPVARRCAALCLRGVHGSAWASGGGGGGGGGDRRRGRESPPAAAGASAGASSALGGVSPAELAATAGKAVEHAARELSRLRGGGAAAPTLLDGVSVAAYGERAPLASLAQVTLASPALFVLSPCVPAARADCIQPPLARRAASGGRAASRHPRPRPAPARRYDAALAPAVAAAVRDAGLGLSPIVDGAVVRVPVPAPSRETRDANLKLVAKIAEAAKATIRRHRQAALDGLKKMDGVSSDAVFRQIKELQEVANKVTDEVTKLAERKRKEIEA